MDLQAFTNLMAQLKSTDNEARKNAETTYNQMDPKVKALHLFNIIGSTDPANPAQLEVALFSAVLLRRAISGSAKEFYMSHNPEDQKAFRSQMLHLLNTNTSRDKNVRKKLCDAVTELMRVITSEEEGTANMSWKELQEFVFNALSGQENHLRTCALIILGDYPSLFGEEGKKRLNQIKITLLRAVMDQDLEIRKLGTMALVNFIMDCAADEKDTTVLKMFQDCMERIYPVVDATIKQSDGDVIQALTDLAENCPKLFRADINAIFDFGTTTMLNTDLSDDLRQNGMELLVTLCEAGPQIVRKHAESKIQQFVLALLKLMTEIEDDEDWLKADENVQEDDVANSYVAESSIDRVACALGGKLMLRPLLTACSEMLASPQWQYRHAALMAISATGEGLQKSMEKNMDEIVNIVKNYINDPHPRVRYASCNCFGQLSTDFQPNFQKKYKQVVLDCLLGAVSNDPEPRVQSHAVAAMINFTEECDDKILGKFLEPILTVLHTSLERKFQEFQATGRKLVLENIITELASLADKVSEKFAPYYERFMPYLKFIVEHLADKKYRLLRGKAIECISIIGECVPKEKFFQDANDVMQLLLKSQTKEVSLDEVSHQYYISAWGRICNILGRDFAVYLPMVMPPVLHSASQQAEINVVDDAEVAEKEEDGWQFVGSPEDGQRVGIKTSGLEEKADSIDTLRVYAMNLKEAFLPYLEASLKVVFESMTFFISEDVRQNASAALPALLKVARANPAPYLLNAWRHYFPGFFQSIKDETDLDTLGEKLQSLGECAFIVGREALTADEINELFGVMETELEEYFSRADERSKKKQDEDYDEEMQESLNEDAKSDYYFISRISDVVHKMFKVYGADLLPRFEKFLNVLMRLGTPGRPYQELQWVICTFDSMLQCAGEKGAVYKTVFMPLFKLGAHHHEPAVRQASIFGYGLMAQYGGDHYVADCAEIFPSLVQHIKNPHARDEENQGPTDNCVSTIVRFMKYRPAVLEAHTGLTGEALLTEFFSWLPIYSDPDETPVVYDFLADLIAQNNPIIVGQNFANIPRIVAIIAEAFEKDALEEEDEDTEPKPPPRANEVFNRLVEIVRHIQQQDAALFEKIAVSLPQDHQKALSDALSKPPRPSLPSSHV